MAADVRLVSGIVDAFLDNSGILEHPRISPKTRLTNGQRVPTKLVTCANVYARRAYATPLNLRRVLPQCFHAQIANANDRPEAMNKSLLLFGIFGCGSRI